MAPIEKRLIDRVMVMGEMPMDYIPLRCVQLFVKEHKYISELFIFPLKLIWDRSHDEISVSIFLTFNRWCLPVIYLELLQINLN